MAPKTAAELARAAVFGVIRRAKRTHFLNLFYSVLIGFAVNYIVYCFQGPIVIAVIPMLAAVFLFVLSIKKKDTKPWQYLCVLPMILISYWFYSFMYTRSVLLLFAAAVLSVLLGAWAVLCIENKIMRKKSSVLYAAAFLLLYLAGCSSVWLYYNEKASAAIGRLAENPDVTLLNDYEAFLMNIASDTDSLCQEIDSIFYASGRNYSLSDLAYGYCYYDDSYKDEYGRLLEKLDQPDFNKARLLLDNMPLSDQDNQ